MVRRPAKNMAVALLAPISAVGRRVFALFRSIFVLVLDAFRRASRRVLQSFSLSARTFSSPTKNQPEQTEHLCSASTSSVTPRPADDSNDLDGRLEGEEGESDAATMTAASSSSAAAPLQLPKKVPVPNIIPALPRLPLQPKRENAVPKRASAPTSQPTAGSASATAANPVSTVTQLSNGLTNLRLDGAVPGKSPLLSLPQPTVEKTASLSNSDKEVAEFDPRPRSCHGFGTETEPKKTSGEVLRYPAVPLSHDVSQTSKLKETTTIMVGGDTVQIRTQTQDETPGQAAERALHSGFMRDALDMARLALKTNETPVGCVLVNKNRVIAKGMNATNVSRNGTRHAELMAICALLSYSPASDVEDSKKKSARKPSAGNMPLGSKTNEAQQPYTETSSWGDVDPRDGHLFPYGQKLHPSPRVDRSVIAECTLYVTVEPCVMCASLLRQLKIKKVYFGAVNDKFGGTGGVFRIHKNSPYSLASAPPSPVSQNGKGVVRPTLERRPTSANTVNDAHASSTDEKSDNDVATPDEAPLPGDGGNVEHGYEVEGGWGRDEAVTLLRQFYVQENGRAPIPRKKEGRAARLAAMMERDGHAGGPMTDSTTTAISQENAEPETVSGERSEAEAGAVQDNEP